MFWFWLVILLLALTADVIMDLCLQRYCMYTCKFDCSKCKNWRCYKIWCDKQRSKLNKKNGDDKNEKK